MITQLCNFLINIVTIWICQNLKNSIERNFWAELLENLIQGNKVEYEREIYDDEDFSIIGHESKNWVK